MLTNRILCLTLITMLGAIASAAAEAPKTKEAPPAYSIVREEKGGPGKYICIESLTPIYLG